MTYTNEMVLPSNFAVHSEEEMMYLDGGHVGINFRLPKMPVKLSVWGITQTAFTTTIKTHAKTPYTRRVVRQGRVYKVQYKNTKDGIEFADKICRLLTISEWFAFS